MPGVSISASDSAVPYPTIPPEHGAAAAAGLRPHRRHTRPGLAGRGLGHRPILLGTLGRVGTLRVMLDIHNNTVNSEVSRRVELNIR